MDIGALVEMVLEAEEIESALEHGRGGFLDLAGKYGYSWASTQPGIAAAIEACKVSEAAGNDIDCEKTTKGIIRQAINTVITKAGLWPPIDALIAAFKLVPKEIRMVIKAVSKTVRELYNLATYVITSAPAWLANKFKGVLKFLSDPKEAVTVLANVLVTTVGGAIIGTLGGLASGLGLPSGGAIPGVDIPGIPIL